MNALKNRVQLIGNIGQNPEVKAFDNKKIAKFSLVTNERYKNHAGEYVDTPTWHNIVAWGKLAEFAEKYLEKGKEIALDGKLTNRSYDDKDGNKRYITEIVVNEFAFVGKKA